MTNKKRADSNNVSRRMFLKGGTILGAAIGLSSLSGGTATEEVAKAIGKKELDHFPHEVSPDFKRYIGSNNTMSRMMTGDQTLLSQLAGLPGIFGDTTDNTKPGYTELDHAFSLGAMSINKDFAFGYDTPLYPRNKKTAKKQYQFASKEDATKAVKKAARFYGADLVGIAPYDEKWMYDGDFSIGDRSIIPDVIPSFKVNSVVVMAFEMDYESMSTAPSMIAEAATDLGYSNMAKTNYMVSTFIRSLGFNAVGSGNDTGLNVPFAIAAGLGEQGRNSIVITYEYGPRVRLCKVFTEMDLVHDKPIEFGANKFCQVCKKCAHSCPSQSISYNDEMTWKAEQESISSHEGVYKYYLNVESCFVYWNTIGNGCSTCITSCPYNKPDFWHHRITTALTATPLKPFLNEMDDIFGYGDIFDEQACINFWDIDVYTK